MLQAGWGDRPNVTILFGRWQDVVGDLKQYDGIFFDTYSEHYEHMQAFHTLLPRILKKDGIYSFFNGLAPRCPFFHAVYTRIVSEELTRLGLETQYMELPVDVGTKMWDGNWQGVKNRYWYQRAYHLPIVFWRDVEEEVAASI
jgi:type IV protein arginine methyltransferase